MEQLRNIFCASNPTKMLDALWALLADDVAHLADMTIFLPSARAARAAEKFIVKKIGHACLMPELVPLGATMDDEDDDEISGADIVSNTERTIALARLLSMDANIKTIANALPLADDLVRMGDYLVRENGQENPDWIHLVSEKYAKHWLAKAKFLSIADSVMPKIFPNKITSAAVQKIGIANWREHLRHRHRVIVAGTTVSIPMQSDLMAEIANMPNGRIILSGKINGNNVNVDGNINSPYYTELQFLRRIGITPTDVQTIDVDDSDIDFYNDAFSNNPNHSAHKISSSIFRIDTARESEESSAISEITARAVADKKSVLVVTPDAAANTRLRAAFAYRGIAANFSDGQKASATKIGREILRALDKIMDDKNASHEIPDLIKFCDELPIDWTTDDAQIANEISNLAKILPENKITSVADIRPVVRFALDAIKLRPTNTDMDVNVLSNIQSRMMSADVVILSGLNDGMFPAMGYENAWLPRAVADSIGLPPPERKVSLMALDFMDLSCAPTVYWTRSRMAGGAETTESRFLSRVSILQNIPFADKILSHARARDHIPEIMQNDAPPAPPHDTGDVWVTDLELLIHNPFAFYAKHILGLKHNPDKWEPIGPREFGILVHDTIEHLSETGDTLSAEKIVSQLDDAAGEIIDKDSVQFHFWHSRFIDMATAILQFINNSVGGENETNMEMQIANRRVRARADRKWNGVVADIKTGSAPNKSQLEKGNMPQLPLEAAMHNADKIEFLQLQNRNVKTIEYSGDELQTMITAAITKTTELFAQYAHDGAPYEYHENNDAKYRAFDDLYRDNS